ncbi:MAG: GntR family transcriptional regulator [Bryobacteraceae bacterium]|nr:GntR family transcriptional regulator [Bryobacteraceae bacterium]
MDRKHGKGGSSRVEIVQRHLLQAIFSGKYPPGSPLRETGLAREFGVSQATVREALQRLEYSGLVSRTVNIGTTVTRLSPSDVQERMELRALLEVRAAKAAAERVGLKEMEEMERRLAVFSGFMNSDSYFESAQADLAFHRYIWSCSENQTLYMLLDQLTVPLLAFASIVLSYGRERLVDVVHAHQPMLDAMRLKDAEKIEDAFRTGAEIFYQEYLGNGSRMRNAVAFGLLSAESPQQELVVR